MSFSRRDLLTAAGAATLAKLATQSNPAQAAESSAPPVHDHAAMLRATESPSPAVPAQPAEQDDRPAGRTWVTTLNGRSLPYRMVNGVKEFHLIAEEVEHEFAPGTKIKAWGYNGSTPGPTIEAVEGDRVRILVTNRLPEHTTIHWHGILLPNGMDGVAGLTQPPIMPGETWAYEFTLRQSGTHLYHPHADEMVQLGIGMMGLFIIHPRDPAVARVDRDFALILHNWAVHPGTYRADPSVMTEFDLWTMNSKVFPAIDPMVVRTGQRVRVRIANLSMHEHPMHLHGYKFQVTGGDGGRWQQSAWHDEVTALVGVGQTRDIEFTATVPGDWAFHCHKSHHTMNAMGHGIPNTVGVKQDGVDAEIRALLPGYMAMGERGMAEHQAHTQMGHMPGPENTLPMMGGIGPFGNLEMGGMFTLLKVRNRMASHYPDPGWYEHPQGTLAYRVSAPEARESQPADGESMKGMDHSEHLHHTPGG
jgi:FtsP/CotA-like multicopper oxidase with cupredoxin domain